jgi:ribosomal protein S11
LVGANYNYINLLKNNIMATWGDVLKGIIPSLVEGGIGLYGNKKASDIAKQQANDAKAVAELQYQTALATERAKALESQGGGKTTEKPKSNTALYIGLGVGGLVLIGAVVFAVTRK